MAELGHMLKWNADFVRGLAQVVLERARMIRSSLPGSAAAAAPVKKAGVKKSVRVKKAGPTKKKAVVAPRRKAKTAAR